MILSCSHISKAFGTDVILDDVSFHIEDNEKAAVVGINGAGKSTLLKIIAGELPADQGEAVLSRGKTLGYLAQQQDLTSHQTIYEELLEVKRPILEMEEQIRAQIREEGLEDTVILLGFMRDVRPLMDVMDVQVNCSFGTEATSLSLLEGMSLGKPAVVTDFGGNPGVIRDEVNGFLVPTHDAPALADALQRLFTETELYEKMRSHALEIYQSKFTSEVNTRNIEAVYSELYQSRRKRR